MSFNVRGASHRDGINDWSERAGMNVETIRRYAPDVIGFQELQKKNLEVYEQEIPHYARLPGPVYGTREVEEHAGIFFDPERFEALESGGFYLSETPEEYSESWGTEVIRCANWACLRCRENNAIFLHSNTHLDHASGDARVEGSRLMLGKVEEIQASRDSVPVVVTGDFNCRPGSPTYQVFSENDFVDTFVEAADGEPEDAYTFHAFEGENFTEDDTAKPAGRLDWILVRYGTGSVKINSHGILRDGDEASGRYPSDHYPVLVGLELGG